MQPNKPNLKTAIAIIGLFFLTSCDETVADYPYLMSHPAALQKKYDHCQANDFSAADCDVVRRAANDFLELVNERSHDAAAFGIKLLKEQMQLAKAESALQQAKQGESRIAAEKAYLAQQQKVDALIAVVATASPE